MSEAVGMNEVWTIAELSGGSLKAVSFELLARGRGLADKLGVHLVSIVLGMPVTPDMPVERGAEGDVLSELIERGADAVVWVENPARLISSARLSRGR